MELLLDTSLIKNGECVAVALSGGRDSVVLFDALYTMAPSGGFSIKAIHVEHGIRGAESLRDEQFVRELCAERGVELKVVKVNVTENLAQYGSVEQTARALRYEAFEQAVADGFCDKIATAHHAGDNAETVLMRALRGTGITGLAGIRKERGIIVRPMLGVATADVDRYARERGLAYVEDQTNFESEYTRNFLRNEIIPRLSERFPAVLESLARLARSAGEADGYIAGVASALVTCERGVVRIAHTSEPVLVKRAVKIGAEHLGVFADVEERHLEIAVQAMEGGKKTYDLPYGIVLERDEDGLTMSYKAQEIGEVCAVLGQNKVGDRIVTIQEIPERVEGALCFSADLDGLVLRGRRQGDSFKRFGGGRKSLGDYLTDTKVPLWERDRLIVLARGSDVLCVVGAEISDGVKVDKNSRKIYKITEEKI